MFASLNEREQELTKGDNHTVHENMKTVKYTKNEELENYKKMFQDNKKWASIHKPQFFTDLLKGQWPDYLIITCSDSRIIPGQILGLNFGQMFMHRNVANMVLPSDTSVNSVINYAVAVLRVKRIIIMGHYGCGGVESCFKDIQIPQLDHWVEEISTMYNLNKYEIESIDDEKLKKRRLVELNVLQQCRNVLKNTLVHRSFKKQGYPLVNAWTFDFSNGYIKEHEFDQVSCLKAQALRQSKGKYQFDSSFDSIDHS